MAEQMEVKHKQTRLFGSVLSSLKTLSASSRQLLSIYSVPCLISSFCSETFDFDYLLCLFNFSRGLQRTETRLPVIEFCKSWR